MKSVLEAERPYFTPFHDNDRVPLPTVPLALKMSCVTKKIPLLIPILLICALLSGLYLPVYSDEVVTKFNISRFFFEDGKMLSFFPQCTTTVGHDVSWLFYPAAIIVSTLYEYLHPLGLRVSGILSAMVWFALLAHWCIKQSKDNWIERFTFFSALASLGVLPYLWVLSRPEQFMLVPIMIFCLTALYPPSTKNIIKQLLILIALSALTSVFFYAHPKSIFFTPFFIIAGWACTRNLRTVIKISFLIFVILLSIQTLRDANLLSLCQDAPSVQAVLGMHSLTPGDLLRDPISFMKIAGRNILDFPDRMLIHLVFNPTFQSGWLPPITHTSPFITLLNLLIHYSLLLLVLGSHTTAMGTALILASRQRISTPVLLSALLAGGDLINLTLYKAQSFYAGIQYVPISIVIVLLLLQGLSAQRKKALSSNAKYTIKLSLFGLSLTSLITLFYLVTPNILRIADFPTASIPSQPLSIPVLGAEEHLVSISELGERCHIPVDAAEHLVVDHMTYFAYLKSHNPIHILYVSQYFGQDLANGKLLPFLKERHSSGLITRCEWVPKEFQNIQLENERGYCCVNFDME